MQKIELTKEQKYNAIQEIREYFAKERDEEMGDLAAEIILDFISEKIASYYYNKAVMDIQQYFSEKIDDLYSFML